MNLSDQKRYARRLDDTGTPKGWPDGWLFPAPPWPPGWPKPLTEKVWLHAEFRKDGGWLWVHVLDEKDEMIDVLNGQYLLVKANDNAGNPVRLKVSGEVHVWSDAGLFEILGESMLMPLEFEIPHPALQIMLYGYENPGRGALVQT